MLLPVLTVSLWQELIWSNKYELILNSSNLFSEAKKLDPRSIIKEFLQYKNKTFTGMDTMEIIVLSIIQVASFRNEFHQVWNSCAGFNFTELLT